MKGSYQPGACISLGADMWSGTLSSRRTLAVPLVATVSLFATLPAAASAVRAGEQVVAEHGVDPGLDLSSTGPVRVIVTGVGNVARAVERHGGRVASQLPIVKGVAAE